MIFGAGSTFVTLQVRGRRSIAANVSLGAGRRFGLNRASAASRTTARLDLPWLNFRAVVIAVAPEQRTSCNAPEGARFLVWNYDKGCVFCVRSGASDQRNGGCLPCHPQQRQRTKSGAR